MKNSVERNFFFHENKIIHFLYVRLKLFIFCSQKDSYDFGGLKTNSKKERSNTNGEGISTQETTNRKTSNLSAEIHW